MIVYRLWMLTLSIVFGALAPWPVLHALSIHLYNQWVWALLHL